jgi:hypothetical protein
LPSLHSRNLRTNHINWWWVSSLSRNHIHLPKEVSTTQLSSNTNPQ